LATVIRPGSHGGIGASVEPCRKQADRRGSASRPGAQFAVELYGAIRAPLDAVVPSNVRHVDFPDDLLIVTPDIDLGVLHNRCSGTVINDEYMLDHGYSPFFAASLRLSLPES